MASKNVITQSRLREVLHYNPDTGVFTWINDTNKRGKSKVGHIAGALSDGYTLISVDRVKYKSHRLAFLYMNGAMPPHDVDHIDGQRSNNSWANLRSCNRQTNMMNRRISSNNKSGVVGVVFIGSSKKWRAVIKINSRKIHIGCFNDFNSAVSARRSAEKKLGFHENHGRQK